MTDRKSTCLRVDERDVVVSNPEKVFFPRLGRTKLDLVQYYLSVAGPALRVLRGRPMILKRYVDGAEGEPFFQKRAPAHPDWLRTARIRFPSGREADEVVLHEPAGLAWVVNLGCIDMNPWPVREEDLDHPDELRVDLDPTPEASWDDVRRVAMLVKELLDEHGLRGFPKTSGSRGIHVLVPLRGRYTFQDVRRGALALAREAERRAPGLATSAWWKEERQGVFLDYNQNARDRTVASAWSVRPTPDARVSMPLRWEEVPGVDPTAYTLDTVPDILGSEGDPFEGIEEAGLPLEPLLELARRDEEQGLGDAPWPPHFRKQRGEGRRAPPSTRRP